MPMWISVILMGLLALLTPAYAGPLEDCEQTQDIDRRIRGCTTRIQQFPRDAAAYFNRSSAYLSLDDVDRAIADATKVIQIDPGWAKAYYNRGLGHERNGAAR